MGIGNPHGYPDYTWPMIWVLQDGELWPIEQWVAKQGVEKNFLVNVSIAAGAFYEVTLYTVPPGKALYVVHWVHSGRIQNTAQVWRAGGGIVFSRIYQAAYIPYSEAIVPPVVVPAGSTLGFRCDSLDASGGYVGTTLRCYEITS